MAPTHNVVEESIRSGSDGWTAYQEAGIVVAAPTRCCCRWATCAISSARTPPWWRRCSGCENEDEHGGIAPLFAPTCVPRCETWLSRSNLTCQVGILA